MIGRLLGSHGLRDKDHTESVLILLAFDKGEGDEVEDQKLLLAQETFICGVKGVEPFQVFQLKR